MHTPRPPPSRLADFPGGTYISLMRFNLTEAKDLDITEAYISLHVRRYEMNQDSIAVYALQAP